MILESCAQKGVTGLTLRCFCLWGQVLLFSPGDPPASASECCNYRLMRPIAAIKALSNHPVDVLRETTFGIRCWYSGFELLKCKVWANCFSQSPTLTPLPSTNSRLAKSEKQIRTGTREAPGKAPLLNVRSLSLPTHLSARKQPSYPLVPSLSYQLPGNSN